MSRAGGVLRRLLDSLAVSVSLGLQRGIPLAAYDQRLALTRFERSGSTPSGVGYSHSIVDYFFRWLALTFPGAGAIDQPLRLPTARRARCAAILSPGARARPVLTEAT